jgi:hypothetical protein
MADRRRGQGSLARAGCTPRGAARRPPPCRASPVAAGRPATLPAGAADRKGRWRSLVHREMLHPFRGGVPGLLGNRRAVLAGRSESSPRTNALARRRSSTLANRPATRPKLGAVKVTIYGWSTGQPLAAGRPCPARQPLRSVRSSLHPQGRPCGRPTGQLYRQDRHAPSSTALATRARRK